MEPSHRPPSMIETLLRLLLGAFFAVDVFLVAPAFASGLGVDLPEGFPRIEPRALLTGGSKLTDSLGDAVKVLSAEMKSQPPLIASSGSNAIVSVYAPMVATPTPLPTDYNEAGPVPGEQDPSSTSATEDPGAPSPTQPLQATHTSVPSVAPSAVGSVTSTTIYSPSPTATPFYSQTPVMTASATAYPSPTRTPTRTKTKTPTSVPPQPTATSLPDGNYYVSTDGNDNNPGTIDRPWQTLAAIHSRNFHPGDVIHFKRGGHWTGGLVIDDSGSEGKPITFTTYGSGERPSFSNPGAAWSYTKAVELKGDWIVIEGFLVHDAHEAGVFISQGSDHNVVRDVEATTVGTGITVAGQYNLVSGNYLHDLTMVVNDPGENNDYGAVGVWLFNSYNEISYNRMVNCRAPSHDYGYDGGAVEWWGDANGNYVHHNWATASNGFFEVGGGSAKNNTVAYNVSVNNGGFFVIHLGGDFGGLVEDFRVENNTVIELAHGNQGWSVIGFGGEPATGLVTLRNNIFYIEKGSGLLGET